MQQDSQPEHRSSFQVLCLRRSLWDTLFPLPQRSPPFPPSAELRTSQSSRNKQEAHAKWAYQLSAQSPMDSKQNHPNAAVLPSLTGSLPHWTAHPWTRHPLGHSLLCNISRSQSLLLSSLPQVQGVCPGIFSPPVWPPSLKHHSCMILPLPRADKASCVSPTTGPHSPLLRVPFLKKTAQTSPSE